ncbi:MAG: PleD family two-component system response regulator [Proteobacteria bacterium]|nr:PleD family two-component system response regulator [Pseudomonadota bacterium]
MSARILVVDDQPLNVKLLEVKLSTEYYEVITATDGEGALATARAARPDLILLDVMMPGMDGFEVCRRLKADPALMHIPVVMVTALDGARDRVRGLEAGADDFITKPVNDVLLFARVRSLLRVKLTFDALRTRNHTSIQLGALDPDGAAADGGADARILVIEDNPPDRDLIAGVLSGEHSVTCISGAEATSTALADAGHDLVIVDLRLDDVSGLRVCSRLRSRDATRNVSLLMLVEESDLNLLAKGLEIGVNDYLVKPIDGNELIARARSQIRHARYQQRLRSAYERSISMAFTDSLTGLYNRRYLTAHLSVSLERLAGEEKSLAVAVIDLDHFKAINDAHGHATGDAVLRELGDLLRRSIRVSDLAARIGGEEFVIVMPAVQLSTTRSIITRLRAEIAATAFATSHVDGGVSMTASIGLAMANGPDDVAETLLARADGALYEAKRGGRNRIVAASRAGK